MTSIRHDLPLAINIAISVFGIFLVLILAFGTPKIHENLLWRKPLIGLLFSLVCILGIFAALSPGQCSQASHLRKETLDSTSHIIRLSSHHPDCGGFSTHVIHISGRDLCAACTGLLLGAHIALLGTASYFFGVWPIRDVGLLAVLIGVAGVVLGFLQLKFRGFIRLTLNTSFVLGAFLILVGMDELTESIFFDCFLLALIVFWILTRIQLSQWDHHRICSNCRSPCDWELKK